VTLVELADRLLLKEEPDAGALIARRLAADGVDLRLGTRAVEVLRPEGAPGQLVLDVDGERDTVTFDRVLVAAGRRPRTAGIGLEAAQVEVDQRAAIVVDDRLRTSAPRIYAAGDVTARLPFTHVAAHHARVASVNALFGMRRTVDETVPWVTFTDPEVAHVGLTEAQARERWGGRTILARSDYAVLDRAITEGEPDGFALLVADPRGRLVGATVAAAGAGEAIAELTARVVAGGKIDALSTTVHAYPTLAEGPSRAADEHLREKYASPRYRAVARAILAARRRLGHVSDADGPKKEHRAVGVRSTRNRIAERRVRRCMTAHATFNGQTIAESDHTILVEGNHYFPVGDVRDEFLQATSSRTLCPWKGIANYWTVEVDGVLAKDAAWGYRRPWPLARRVKGRIAFWNAVAVHAD